MATHEPIRPYTAPSSQELGQRFHGAEIADDQLRARAGQVPRAYAEFNGQTLQNMEQLERRMQMSPPPSGWVVNLHPWHIRTNAGRLMREAVPACEYIEVGADEPSFSYLEIPWHEIDMRPQVDGSYACDPIEPIVQAGQFMREGNTNELWGPGVFVYEGPKTPEEMWAENPEIQVFTDRGWPVTTKVKAKVRQRGSRELVDGERLLPVRKTFREVFQEIRTRRNEAYMRLVREADEKLHAAKPEQRNWHLSGTLRLMARMLVAERLLPKLPAWNLETTLDVGEEAEKCKRCRTAKKKDAVVCHACGTPYDLIQALKDGLIDFDYMGIKFLEPEQLAEVMRLKKQVETNQKKAGLILANEAKEKAEPSGQD